MTVAAVLVAYAACLGTLGSRLLGRARWTVRAPLLAIVTYLAVGWSVIAALGLAGVTLATRSCGFGGSWDLASRWGAGGGSCSARPPQRSP